MQSVFIPAASQIQFHTEDKEETFVKAAVINIFTSFQLQQRINLISS